MKFDQETATGGYTILSYTLSTVRVLPPLQEAGSSDPDAAALELEHSFIISPQALNTAWTPQHLERMEAQHLQQLLEMEPELVLLGTGQRLRFPATEVLLPLIQAGVGYEVMDMAAACRTFNILAAEGRRVVAGILLD